ncbi:DUF4390 domain-containing protein [Kaarinaea lacus]
MPVGTALWCEVSWRNLPLRAVSLGTLLLGTTCSAPLFANEPGFTITRAEAKLVNQVYHLSVQIEYEFSKKVLEAIQSGVPMVIALEIEVRRPRKYMWDEQIAQLKQRFQLQYHALAEQYIVENLNSGAQNTAPTLSTALFYLRDIDNLPLIDQQLLESGEAYQVRLKVALEFDSLPVPLKLNAYTSKSWWLGSGWFVWDL